MIHLMMMMVVVEMTKKLSFPTLLYVIIISFGDRFGRTEIYSFHMN